MAETVFPPLRLALIGGFGHHYLQPALDDASIDIEAVAVAPGYNDAERTRERFAARLEAGAQWFDSADALLDTFKPNLVNVGTLFAHNGPVSLKALRRGINTVSDKPVAADWETYEELESLLGQADAPTLVTEFDFRTRKDFRAAAQAVADGLLGEIVLANAQKTYRFGNRPDFYKSRKDYASTLLWVASHGIDALRFVTGLEITPVHAQHGNIARPDYGEMEDHCAAMYTLSNGGTGIVHADFLRPAAALTHGDDRIRVVGSKGTLEVRDNACVLTTMDEGPRDIVDTVSPRPIHTEMLDAAANGNATWFGNAQSLELAKLLLHTRDLADGVVA